MTPNGERLLDRCTTHEFEADADVERPAELGSPGVGEWLWRLFVY